MSWSVRSIRILVLALAGLALSAGSIASDEAPLERLFGLGPVDTFTLESDSLGRDFHIYVRLPRDYAESDCDWPVVYMLDGGILFPMLAPLHLMMEIDELAPPAVLVGISYGGLGYANGNMRSTDYTAPAPEPEYYGGADHYQRFLAEELVPRIDAGYRVDHERSLVLGQSLGGQFTLYTALARPDLFGAYLSINPALHRNLDYFLDLEPAGRNAATPLMITRSSEEDARLSEPLDRWLQDWRSGGSSALALTVRPLEGQHHASSAPAAYLEAIRWWTTGWSDSCRSDD